MDDELIRRKLKLCWDSNNTLQRVGTPHIVLEKTVSPGGFRMLGDESHRYQFVDRVGVKKYVDIVHHNVDGETTADIMFHDSEAKPDDEESLYRATGRSKTSSIKTFSTIKKIMKHHAKNRPHISHYEFTSYFEEPSRVSLYRRMTKHLGGESKTDYEYTYHRIPVKNLIKK